MGRVVGAPGCALRLCTEEEVMVSERAKHQEEVQQLQVEALHRVIMRLEGHQEAIEMQYDIYIYI